MDKEQIEQIIEDYIKQNLTVQIEEKTDWMSGGGKYFEVKVCLGSEVIYTSCT